MKIKHEVIDSISKVVQHNNVVYRVELKENFYFSGSGSKTQYFDSEREIVNHLGDIVYCDGR